MSVNSDVKIMEALEGMRMVKNVTYEWENKSNLEIVEEVFEEYKEGFVKGEVVKIDPGYRWDGGKTPLIYHLTKGERERGGRRWKVEGGGRKRVFLFFIYFNG